MKTLLIIKTPVGVFHTPIHGVKDGPITYLNALQGYVPRLIREMEYMTAMDENGVWHLLPESLLNNSAFTVEFVEE